jgi:hypothetical protein
MSAHTRRALAVAAATVVLSPLLAACGGDDGDDAAVAPTVPQTEPTDQAPDTGDDATDTGAGLCPSVEEVAAIIDPVLSDGPLESVEGPARYWTCSYFDAGARTPNLPGEFSVQISTYDSEAAAIDAFAKGRAAQIESGYDAIDQPGIGSEAYFLSDITLYIRDGASQITIDLETGTAPRKDAMVEAARLFLDPELYAAAE